MIQKNSELLKILACVLKFFIVHQYIIIFLSNETKNFRIAQKLLDSNATLLPGFFLSLAPPFGWQVWGQLLAG